jgi:DNA-binding response OmpR family regulator
VLGISANTDDANRARCREAGMSGLIGKPVSPATLAAALASLCCTPAAGAPRRRPWFDDGAGADRDARAVRDPRAAGVTAQRNGARSAPGFRLEEALDEQLALHGAAHPLTRALMRAAGRSPADVDRPLSLPVR